MFTCEFRQKTYMLQGTAFTGGPDGLNLSRFFRVNTVLGISLPTSPAQMQWALPVIRLELAPESPVDDDGRACLKFCICLG